MINLKKYMLKPGYIYFAREPVLISTVLGSCVSVTLYDRKNKIGGMNHFKLPLPQDGKYTADYGLCSVYKLIEILRENNSLKTDIEAQIFGGARNPAFSNNIGELNISIAEKILRKEGIKIISTDTGGQIGRKIIFNSSTGETIIAKVKKLRKIDWV